MAAAHSGTATRRLFGTDGVRGVAGEFLSAELALSLARAATARVAALVDHDPRVLVIRDTRESGEMLEAAVAAGIAEAGGEALLGGVLPTPGAPLLVTQYGFDAGVVISASHNPYRDNGIKFFGGDGFKLSDAVEAEIEQALERPPGPARRIGRVRDLHGALEDYLRRLRERFDGLDLTGRRIALDCANGATYRAAPEVFRRLGADVTVVADAPDGRNINDGCGSTHLDGLIALMRAGDHDAGFAFDGDGDRVLAVDRSGAVVDGDEMIALAAVHLRGRDRLPGGGVAVTVMTNYGFHTAMAAHDIAGRHDRRGRPLRARGPARARLGARRRAVRARHRHGLRAVRRRHRLGAARRSRRSAARTSRPATRWRSSRRRWSTSACATATPTGSTPGCRSSWPPSTTGSRAAAGSSCARAAPSRSCG